MADIRRSKLQGLPSYFQAWGLKSYANDAAFVTGKGSAAASGDAYYSTDNNEVRVFDGTNWRPVITGDASGNVIIDGNLTVDGTTTTINSQTLDVEDANITINNGGNQTAADDTAGITVEMSDAQNVGIIYDKDLASRWKAGDTNALVELANVSSTQTLTNKTIDADNNTISNLAHGAEVDNPTSGVHGVTGSVVGTSDSQTLTNKTIVAANNSISGLLHGTHVDNPTSGVHGVTGNVVGTSDSQTLTNKTIVAANNTISGLLHGTHVDNPTSGVHGVTGNVVGTSDSQTLTNKSIDADQNTITNIDNADIKAGAAIDRTKIANGTADHVVINNASGTLSSEAALAKVRGGTGADNSSVTFPSSGTIVTEAGTQTLSNKSISDALTYSHISTPSSPSAGALKIYAKNDDKFYKLNSLGEEVEIGSGAGGSGSKNYFDNPEFETNIDDVTTYDDTGAYVDGTGGAPSTLTIFRNTTTPLAGTGDLQISKSAANGSGEGVTLTTRTIDRADRGENLIIQFEWDGTHANYASGDMKLYAYSTGTDATILPVYPIAGLNDDGTLPQQKTKIVAYVPTSSTTDSTVRVSLHVETTNASAYDVYVDSFKVGPDTVAVVGSGVIGEVIALPSTTTPANFLYCNGAAVSRTTYSELFAVIGVSHGSGNGSTTFNLPDYRGRFLRAQDDGASRDPNDTTRTAMNTGGNTGDNVGSVQSDAFQGHEHTQLGVSAATSASGAVTRVAASNQATQAIVSDGVNGTPRTSSETRPVNAYVRYYIRYSTGGNVISTTEAAFSTPKLSLTSTNGVSVTSSITKITFNNVVQQSGGINYSSGEFIAPRTGYYFVNGFMGSGSAISYAINGNSSFFAYVNGSEAARLCVFRAQTTTAVFATLNITGAFYAAKGDTVDFRISSTVSYTTSTSAAASYISMTFVPDFSTFSVFGKSEVIEAGENSTPQTYSITAGQAGDLTSILVPPGEWDVQAAILWDSNGVTTTTDIQCWTSTTSGNSTTGRILAANSAINTKSNTSGDIDTTVTPVYKYTFTSPTTLYLKARADTSITNLRVYYNIRARRIK